MNKFNTAFVVFLIYILKYVISISNFIYLTKLIKRHEKNYHFSSVISNS
jgi:hypothetical protein